MKQDKMAKITRSGQITIPKDIREFCHLSEGDYVIIERKAEGILIRPVETVAKKITMPEIVERTNKAKKEGKVTQVSSISELEDFINGI